MTFVIAEVDSLENESIAITMVSLTNEENWAALERVRRVEFLFWWRGRVGWQDLVDILEALMMAKSTRRVEMTTNVAILT